MESSNEAKNEIEISNIEGTWKGAVFTLGQHNKGTEPTYLLRATEDVKLLLED
jgi:hypothetical protein